MDEAIRGAFEYYPYIQVAKWTKQYAAHLSTKYKDDQHLISVAQGLTKEHILGMCTHAIDCWVTMNPKA